MVTPPVTLLSNMAYYIIINHAGTVQVLAISYLSHYHFSSTHNSVITHTISATKSLLTDPQRPALAPTTHSDPNACGGDWHMNIH